MNGTLMDGQDKTYHDSMVYIILVRVCSASMECQVFLWAT